MVLCYLFLSVYENRYEYNHENFTDTYIAYFNCTASYRNSFGEIQQTQIFYYVNVLARSRCAAVSSRQLCKIIVIFVFVSENAFSSLSFNADKIEQLGTIS
jgi:hypothetical protein